MDVRIIRNIARGLQSDERGLTTVEYVIVLCLIAALAVGTWKTFGGHVNDYLIKADGDISTSMPH